MKGKQIVALVVAAVLFIVIGASNVLVQVEAEKERVTSEKETEDYLETLLGLSREKSDYRASLPVGDFVGVISVTGTIENTGDTAYLNDFLGYFHEDTLSYIDALMDSDSNRAILLYEETPGGTIIDSDELYLKLMEYKETTGRPVYAYMHSYAYSGGYYIAMAADRIIANRNATTGSIGVIVSTYDMSGLYEKLGVKPINITSGENKAMFTGDEEQEKEQIAMYQEIVNESYEQFLDIVKKGRNLTDAQIRPYADGSIFTAQKAKKLGLIDDIVDTYDDALAVIAEDLEDTSITFSSMPVPRLTLLEKLFLKAETLLPKSDNQVLQEMTNLKDKGLMYYAEP